MAALIAVVVPLAINVHVLEYDEAVFMGVARNIQRLGLPFRSLGEQGQPAFEHTPLYLYVLSLYARPSEIGIFGARLVTLAFGLGSVWLTFEIGRRIRDSLAGFVAALLLAINAFFALHTFFVRMAIQHFGWEPAGRQIGDIYRELLGETADKAASAPKWAVSGK